MVQTLARCRNCGLPTRIAEALTWGVLGSIRTLRFKGVRLAMVDQETMAGSRAAVCAKVGDEEIFAREKEAARSLASRQLRGIKEKISRYGVVKKRVLEAMEDYSIVLGAGRIEMEKFAPGKGGSWVVKAAFDDIMVDAAIAGILEELDACEYGRRHAEAGRGAYRLELLATGRRAPGPQQAEEESVAARSEKKEEGDHLDRCVQCGLPVGLTAFSWNEIFGSMETFPGRRRVALVPAYALEVMAAAAAEGAGDGSPDPLREAARTAAAERLARPEEDAFDGGRGFAEATADPRMEDFLREKLSLRGWGSVRGFAQTEGAWRVEVGGPVDAQLVAGWLEAVFAAARGRETRAGVETFEDVAVYLLR